MPYDETADSGIPARPPNTSYVQLPYADTETPRAPRIHWGSGTPESAVTGRIGDLFLRNDGGGASTTLYVKESGVDTNTGWVAK